MITPAIALQSAKTCPVWARSIPAARTTAITSTGIFRRRGTHFRSTCTPRLQE